MTYTGWCMKCKEKREMKDGAELVKTSRGGNMAKGVCSKCGTKMSAMLKKTD